jgi:solute carrier family 13 (sodium-dependent dicarboxylate transporter), member 2/3/5
MLHVSATPKNPNVPALRSFIAPIAAMTLIGFVWFGTDLSGDARVALVTFGLAVIGWVFTKINDTYIALGAALTLTLTGVQDSDAVFASLGDSMIWLLIAAFIVAAAVKASGLANRLAAIVASRTRHVTGLFYTLTGAIILTAFFIPSTSGRAALLVPVFVALAGAIPNPRVVKALAILFPTIILLSAVASLIGAGAHLVTADMVAHTGGERLDFLRWMLLGTPLALVSSYASTWVILHVFLTSSERRELLEFSSSASPDLQLPGRLGAVERFTLLSVLALVGLWATESLHGIDNTVVALVGALVVTWPKRGAISFKDGLKSVEWNTLLFMAATLELGEALVASGSAKALVEGLFAGLGNTATSSPVVIVAVIVTLSLVAHLVVVSRTARSSVLVPLVIALALGLGYSSTALAFASTAAAGYCLTLIVSAKPLTIFSGLAFPTFEARDLLKLSSLLMPLHAVIFAVFTLLIWPLMGMPLQQPIAAIAPITKTALEPNRKAWRAILGNETPRIQATKPTPPSSQKVSANNGLFNLSSNGNLSDNSKATPPSTNRAPTRAASTAKARQPTRPATLKRTVPRTQNAAKPRVSSSSKQATAPSNAPRAVSKPSPRKAPAPIIPRAAPMPARTKPAPAVDRSKLWPTGSNATPSNPSRAETPPEPRVSPEPRQVPEPDDDDD